MIKLNENEMMNLGGYAVNDKHFLVNKLIRLFDDIQHYRKNTGNRTINNLIVPYIVYKQNNNGIENVTVDVMKDDNTNDWNNFRFNDGSNNSHLIIDIKDIHSVNDMCVSNRIQTEYNLVILYIDNVILLTGEYTIKCITIEEIPINDLFKIYVKLQKKYNDKLIELQRWETTRNLLM